MKRKHPYLLTEEEAEKLWDRAREFTFVGVTEEERKKLPPPPVE